jgi:transcriptional regulator with XRE-family HTH domain
MPDKPLTSIEIERNRNLLRPLTLWLKLRKVTQRQLAEALSVSEGSVSKWLSGTQQMNLSQFQAIAAILKSDPFELLRAPGEAGSAQADKDVVALTQVMTPEQLRLWIKLGRQIADDD